MLLTPAEQARLAALAAARRHAAPGAAGGSRPGPRKGAGGDFAGHRPYAAGDDPRHIDWNAYGRTDALHVKEFREEVEGALTVVLDLSASMGFGGKREQALRIAAAAGVVSLALGDRARIAPFGREPRMFTAAQEVPELDRWLESLEAAGPSVGRDAARALVGGRRGRVLFVSDLMEEEGAGPALIMLRERGHAVTVAHVLSREEASPPAGHLHLQDSESGEVREVLVDADTAAAYARVLEEFCAGWQTLCASHAIAYARVLAGTPLAEWAEALC